LTLYSARRSRPGRGIGGWRAVATEPLHTPYERNVMYVTLQLFRWNVIFTIGKRYEYLHGLTPFDLEIEVNRILDKI
jgi:hypothetical protein